MFTNIHYIHHRGSFNFMTPNRLQIFYHILKINWNSRWSKPKKSIYTNNQVDR